MSTVSSQQANYIDRKVASKLLRVSIRTIDRYIRSGKLTAVQKNGRIWVERKQVDNFSAWDNAVPVTVVDTRAPQAQHIATPAVTPTINRPVTRTPEVVNAQTNESHFYKDLYEDAKVIIRDYQKKLENTQYRMNQLESQIVSLQNTTQHTAPQQIAVREIREVNDHGHRDDHISLELLKKDFIQKEREFESIKDALQKEQTNKIIFAVIAYALLALQPVIWYLALN
ncbi:helix-turn-helix domain-containing protein [Candidatus Gracilibacteria bacterium]|nr:helix-turn-helix domain-containing protein [Candidatus Gracilibacteria bacterium]